MVRRVRFALCAFPLILGLACSRHEAPPAPPAVVVTVAHPIVQEVLDWDEFIGRLDATETVEVRARVTGLIESQHFKDGQLIKKGELLFVIDPRPFRADLEKAQADVARAEASVEQARGDVDRAERAGPGAVPEEEIATRRIQLKEAEASLLAAQAMRDTAALNLEWTQVRAGASGRLSRAYVTPGNLVTGGAQGTLLTTIVSQDPIYCYIDADEQSVQKYIRLAAEGKRITARKQPIIAYGALATETEFRHVGVIDFVNNRVDPGTGTLRGRAVFPNPDESLIPGFFCRVRIPAGGRYQAMLVPDAAINTDQGQKFVYVVNGQGKAEERQIEVGTVFGSLRAVMHGLSADDRVIVNGMLRVRPGVQVSPTETTLTPPAQLPDAMPTTLPTTLPTIQAPVTAPAFGG